MSDRDDLDYIIIERKRGGEKITRKRKRQQLDAIAAAGFLQAFLDGKLAPFARAAVGVGDVQAGCRVDRHDPTSEAKERFGRS